MATPSQQNDFELHLGLIYLRYCHLRRLEHLLDLHKSKHADFAHLQLLKQDGAVRPDGRQCHPVRLRVPDDNQDAELHHRRLATKESASEQKTDADVYSDLLLSGGLDLLVVLHVGLLRRVVVAQLHLVERAVHCDASAPDGHHHQPRYGGQNDHTGAS